MFTHQFFDLLLNLDTNWQEEEVEADYTTSEVRITIQFTGKTAVCPTTYEICKLHDKAPKREWRHLDTMQYKTYIRF